MGKKPIISIVTRTHMRPFALSQCVASVEAQTDRGFQHILIHDDVGLGVAGAQALLIGAKPLGHYVMILDDDDLLVSPWFVSDIRAAAQGYNPDVVVFKMNNAELGILPDQFVWQQKPKLGHIGGCNIAVKRHVWDACIWAIGTDGEGGPPVYHSDFIYINEVWKHTRRIHWMDKIQVVVSRVSRGTME